MAYMNQERKAEINKALKAALPADWKYSLSVNNHSTIVFVLRQANADVIGNIAKTIDTIGSAESVDEAKAYWSFNPYYLERQCSGEVLDLIEKVKECLNTGNWDKSDIQTDYFNVGWYITINVGGYDNPFIQTMPSNALKVAKAYSSPSKPKPAPAKLAPYLPADWATLSPGRKAAATKRAMLLAA